MATLNVDYLLKNEEILSGVLLNYKPKSIFDSGRVKGFLHYKSIDYAVLKTEHGDRYEVDLNSLISPYKTVYEYKNSENKLVVLEELLKYGTLNEVTLHSFSHEKEVLDFLERKKLQSEEDYDNKWHIIFHSKISEKIYIKIDL